MQIELRRLPKEQVASFQFGGEGLALEDLELMVHIDLISILKYKAAKGELGEFFG